MESRPDGVDGHRKGRGNLLAAQASHGDQQEGETLVLGELRERMLESAELLAIARGTLRRELERSEQRVRKMAARSSPTEQGPAPPTHQLRSDPKQDRARA